MGAVIYRCKTEGSTMLPVVSFTQNSLDKYKINDIMFFMRIYF